MVKQSCLDNIKSDILANTHLTRGDDILVSYLIKKLNKQTHLPTVSLIFA